MQFAILHIFNVCAYISTEVFMYVYRYVCTVLHTEERMSDVHAQAPDVSRRRWFISWRRVRILKNQAWTKSLPIHASCMCAKLLQS